MELSKQELALVLNALEALSMKGVNLNISSAILNLASKMQVELNKPDKEVSSD